MEYQVKKSLICKDVHQYELNTGMTKSYLPMVGDVALFRVKTIGKHTRIHNAERINQHLFPGDYVLCAFGNRYATNQIEGYVPDGIFEEYHILGQGGVVGVVKSMYKPLEAKGPTTLELVGYAVNPFGRVINTIHPVQRLKETAAECNPHTRVILSVGTSMDSGKTTTAGFLCRGIRHAGKRVAYMKLTGTVYSKDPQYAVDCGAMASIDFSHFGYPSTYMCSEEELLLLFRALKGKLAAGRYDYIVVEIADGLLQRETSMLLQNPLFMSQVHHVIFSAGDSLGVLSGLELLHKWGIQPFAVSGLFTARPLLVEEVAAQLSINVLTLEDMEQASLLNYLEFTENYHQNGTQVRVA
ncbi:MAG: hypothetical protein D6730_12885 [Bacteroidetes bacterium]|nr:MAG: hypothetical protein D6730_12885 [Bacteroidota bacterium]